MKSFLPVVLSAAYRSAIPTLSLMAVATLLTGCNQSQPQNVTLVVPDFHSPTYVGGQFSNAPAMDTHRHLRSHASTLNVVLISRHAPHH